MNAKLAGAGRRGLWVALLTILVVLLPIRALASNADASGGPHAKGRNSTTEEPQGDFSGPSPRGVAMPGSRREPEADPAAEQGAAPVSAMDRVLKRPHAARRGDLPPASSVPSAQPSAAESEQSGPVRRARSPRRSLKLVLKVKEDGTSEVVSATEVRGETPVTEEALGDYIYEVTDGNRSVSVQAIPDPFVAHSFGGPEDEKRGHAEFRSKEAEVVVVIPGLGLDSRLDRLALRLYRLKPGAPVERVNAAVVARLKADTRLELLAAPQTTKLVEQIRQRGFRARE